MAKRLVEIDDDLLEQARQALGTSTIKETVNTALLEETVRAAWCRSITKEDLRR
ncbi:MAG: type II toxin-antitoxin system VapB family antitoxin, partial [Euzebyaceae bacterium]|nr:type II toxin-antitoxin system VapB family antitoxin [Euzebyaceae bacterium]